jgi:hypothetical protein
VQTSKFKVEVEVTLRLAVYRQSFSLSAKPLHINDQFFFSTQPLCR